MTRSTPPRRLDLATLGPLDRAAARTGLIVAAVTGTAVVAVGSDLVQVSSLRVTPGGAVSVLADWVVVVPLLALATAAYLVTSARPDRRWRRVGFAVLAASWAGTIQLAIAETAAAYADPLPAALWAARVSTWIAIGLAAAASIAPDQPGRSARLVSATAAVPFILLAGAYLLAVSAPGPLHVMRAALRDAISTTFYASLDVLILLFLWQAVEGVHASKVAVTATISRWRSGWVAAAVAAKVIALALAVVLVSPAVSPALEGFRSDGPFAWAYALVLAVGVVLLLRNGSVDTATPPQHAVGAALVLLGFIAPGLLAGAYVGGLAPLRLLVPGSVPELAGLAVAATATAAVTLGVRGHTRLSLAAAAGGAVLAGILIARPLTETPTPFAGLHDRLLDVGHRLVELHDRWTQPWALLVMTLAFGTAVWLVRGRHRRSPGSGAVLAVAAIGVWAAPRTIQVGAHELRDATLSVAPEPLTFDAALLMVVVGAIVWSLLSRRRLPDDTIGLGAAVALVSVVTLVPELIRPAMTTLLGWLEGPLAIDAANLGFALLLVIPAAYAFAFDATALNARSAAGAPTTAIGMTTLVFGFAVLQLAFATQPDLSRDLVAVLFLVPLAALTALEVGRWIAPGRPVQSDHTRDGDDSPGR